MVSGTLKPLGLAWLGLAWLGLAWLGLAWLGLAWSSLAYAQQADVEGAWIAQPALAWSIEQSIDPEGGWVSEPDLEDEGSTEDRVEGPSCQIHEPTLVSVELSGGWLTARCTDEATSDVTLHIELTHASGDRVARAEGLDCSQTIALDIAEAVDSTGTGFTIDVFFESAGGTGSLPPILARSTEGEVEEFLVEELSGELPEGIPLVGPDGNAFHVDAVALEVL